MEREMYIRSIEQDMDQEALSELLSAVMKGWPRACPGEGLHIMSLPRKSEGAERWLFEQIHKIITEYMERE